MIVVCIIYLRNSIGLIYLVSNEMDRISKVYTFLPGWELYTFEILKELGIDIMSIPRIIPRGYL